MDDLYKENQLYNTLDLFCKLRLISKSAMCNKAGVSPGIISDLKFGRKQTIQIETASKMATALNTTVSAIEKNSFVASHWDSETVLKWHDCDSDEERIQILRDYGVDTTVLLMKQYRKFTDTVILQNPNQRDQKQKSPTPEGVELDSDTMELLEAWNSGDDAREFLLSAARMIKSRRDDQ